MITAGTNRSAVNIALVNDDVVERLETFGMSLAVPSLLGPGIRTGAITNATGTIIDTSSELCY